MSEPLLPFFEGIVAAAAHVDRRLELSTLRDDAHRLSAGVRKTPDCTVDGKVGLGQDWLRCRVADPAQPLDIGTMVGNVVGNESLDPSRRLSYVQIADPSLRELALGAEVAIVHLLPTYRIAHLPASTDWLSGLQERYRARGFSEDETRQLLAHEVVDRMLQRQFLGRFPIRWPDWAPFGGVSQERYGFLRVETQPSEAIVWVDDMRWGPSPQEQAIRTGQYSLKATKQTNGHVLAGNDKVSVEPGGRATKCLTLA
jgi:hypothetical protein